MFKLGDKVRITAEHFFPSHVGKEGIVTMVDEDDAVIVGSVIKGDDIQPSFDLKHDGGQWIPNDWLELA